MLGSALIKHVANGLSTLQSEFLSDEIAGLVLQRLDGIKSSGLLFDDLSSEFSAPREVIQTDVLALLQPLADKGILKYDETCQRKPSPICTSG